MQDLPVEIEVQRVLNLIRGFGWDKVKEEVIGNEIFLTIKKVVLAEEVVTGGPPPS